MTDDAELSPRARYALTTPRSRSALSRDRDELLRRAFELPRAELLVALLQEVHEQAGSLVGVGVGLDRRGGRRAHRVKAAVDVRDLAGDPA